MNKKWMVLILTGLLVLIPAIQLLHPAPGILYILKIPKTGGVMDMLRQRGDIAVFQELNSCGLAFADEETLFRLKGRGLRYEILGRSRAGTEGLFMMALKDPRRLDQLKPFGTAYWLERDHILFISRDGQHPLRMFPELIREIKKLSPHRVVETVTSGWAEDYRRESISAYNPAIAAMANQVSPSNIQANIQVLQNFVTRDAESNGCKLAGDFLLSKLTQMGIQASAVDFGFEGLTSRNIIGYLPGKKTPSAVVIICAHYDSYSNTGGAAPGADDNGSGVAAVLEAAKIMCKYTFSYSVKFILFSAEEWGLYGSAHYAADAKRRGENIIGVINMDMISYTDHLPEDLDVIVNSSSKWLGAILEAAAANYSSIDVASTVDGSYDYSDHSSFWDKGFPAVLAIEDYEDTNPYYHTAGDTLSTINLDFLTQAARTCLAATAQLAIPEATATASVTVTSPNGGEKWLVGSSHPITWSSSGTVGALKILYTTNNGGDWRAIVSSTPNDGSYTWTVPNNPSTQCLVRISEAGDGSPADSGNGLFSILSGSSGIISLSRGTLKFGAMQGGAAPGAQTFQISNSGGGTLKWTVTDNVSWLSCTPVSGVNGAIITVKVNAAGLMPGSYTGRIAITDPSAANSPRTVVVTLTVKSLQQNQAPIGEFSTPINGAKVTGSIPVTGWALDDAGAPSIRIYRGDGSNMVYIGAPSFVEGARPDVETAYPNLPENYRAGWGYMLLTYFLPNGGNGTFTLYVTATDHAGRQTTLGSRTITVDNAHAVKPFGAIDTPEQGGTATGKGYINFGWVLTPQPDVIPTNGSTLNVWVDGVNKGHPAYNKHRSDIAGLFPGYANSNGAAGYFSLDTTKYANGVHTIQWTATDSGGHTDGIGSRYFTVSNMGGSAPERRDGENSPGEDISGFEYYNRAADRWPAEISVSGNFSTPVSLEALPVNEQGTAQLEVHELEHVEIRLGVTQGTLWGRLAARDELRPLPAGSTLDVGSGTFYWSPGPGFIGRYSLVFMRRDPSGRLFGKKLDILITPKHWPDSPRKR